MEKTKHGQNRLSLANRVQIWGWAEANKEIIEDGSITKDQALVIVSTLCGNKVVLANLMSITLELGIKWLRRRASAAREFTPIDQKAVATLVAAVSDLYIEGNIKMPEALKDLRETYVETLVLKPEEDDD